MYWIHRQPSLINVKNQSPGGSALLYYVKSLYGCILADISASSRQNWKVLGVNRRDFDLIVAKYIDSNL
jgi:hypothetical protein